MTDALDCHVVHATTRRVRLQIPAKRHDKSFFNSFRDHLSQRPGVVRVHVNPATTSVIIDAANIRTLLDFLQEGGLRFSEPPAQNKFEPENKLLLNLQRRFGRIGSRTNVARASVFLFVGASIGFKIARGNQLSAAAMLLLYGGRTARRWWLSSREPGRLLTGGAPRSLEDSIGNRSNQLAPS